MPLSERWNSPTGVLRDEAGGHCGDELGGAGCRLGERHDEVVIDMGEL